MKKVLSFLLVVSSFSSCTNSIIDEQQLDFAEKESICVSEDHSVKLEDVRKLSQGLCNNTRSASQATTEIECLKGEKNDTLLYVSKKSDGGWTIYSSDTRVPAVVAHSDSGSYEKLMEIEGARLWIQSIAEDMALIKKLPDNGLNFSQKEIADNKAFWESISSPDKFVKEHLLTSTRAIGDPTLPRFGHYEYRSSTTYSEVYDCASRMTVTDWHQNSPYNRWCPLTSSHDDYAPAGCVAIAAAQMLYFLHDHYGVPTTAPSEAYCYGDVIYFNYDQTNYTTDIWNYMNISGYNAAPLIANVGKRIAMTYGDSGSSGSFSLLPYTVFPPYGISCSDAVYDEEVLCNSLINGMPVLLSAQSEAPENVEIDEAGHAFIADRYQFSNIVTRSVYEWVYDLPSDKPRPLVEDKIEYTYSTPPIREIGMNWGWGSDHYNPNEWFALTGNWITRVNNKYRNWNISRRMIHNFQVINN